MKELSCRPNCSDRPTEASYIYLSRRVIPEAAMFKRTLALLITLSGLSGVALAQTPPAQPSSVRHDLGTDDADIAPPPVAQTCTLPEIVDQVPLEQVSGSDLMTVPISINGTTKEFLLDIGMTKPTSISPELMAKLGLPETPKFGGSTGSI